MSQVSIPEVPATKQVVSIQVQTTKLTGAGVEVVSYNKRANEATHWSLYLRYADGSVSWVTDLRIEVGRGAHAYYGDAMIAAAKLSMEHKVYIERIQ